MKPRRPILRPRPRVLLAVALCGLSYAAGVLLGAHRQTLFTIPSYVPAENPAFVPSAPPVPVPAVLQDSHSSLSTLPRRQATVEEIAARLQAIDSLGPDYTFEIAPMLFSLPAAEYPRLWALRKRLPSPELAEQLQSSLVYLWSKKDPSGAILAFQSLPEGDQRDYAQNVALSSWGAKDPDAALAWIQKIPEKRARTVSLAWAITGVAKIDPHRALQLLNDLPKGHTRQLAVAAVAEQFARVDADVAIRLAAECDEIRGGMVLELIAGTRAEQDLAGALDWARGIADPARRALLLAAVVRRAAATTDPFQLAALAEAEPDTGLRKQLLATVVAGWSETDLPLALAWANALPDPESRREAWSVLLTRVAFPTAAQFLVSDAPPGPDRLQKLESLASGLASEDADDFTAGIAWVSSLPAGPDRDALVTGLARTLSSPSVAELALTIRDPELQSKAAVDLVANLSRFHPQGAVHFLNSLPEGQARSMAATQLAQSWARLDPAAAFTWLRSLPENPLRSKAAESFFHATIGLRDDLAAHSLALVGDQHKVHQLVADVLRLWPKAETQAAEAWLKSLPGDLNH